MLNNEQRVVVAGFPLGIQTASIPGRGATLFCGTHSGIPQRAVSVTLSYTGAGPQFLTNTLSISKITQQDSMFILTVPHWHRDMLQPRSGRSLGWGSGSATADDPRQPQTCLEQVQHGGLVIALVRCLADQAEGCVQLIQNCGF